MGMMKIKAYHSGGVHEFEAECELKPGSTDKEFVNEVQDIIFDLAQKPDSMMLIGDYVINLAAYSAFRVSYLDV